MQFLLAQSSVSYTSPGKWFQICKIGRSSRSLGKGSSRLVFESFNQPCEMSRQLCVYGGIKRCIFCVPCTHGCRVLENKNSCFTLSFTMTIQWTLLWFFNSISSLNSTQYIDTYIFVILAKLWVSTLFVARTCKRCSQHIDMYVLCLFFHILHWWQLGYYILSSVFNL